MLPKLYVVGEQSILLNRLDEAAWCFEKAAEFDPASPQPLMGLAKVRQLQERPADARRLMAEAIARGGGTAQGYTILGQICQAEGDFGGAIAAFEQAIAIDPNHGPAYLRLALLGRPENPAARIAELERLAAAPDLTLDQLATLGFALGRLYETEGDHDRAFARYKSANDIRRSQYPGYSNTFCSADPMIRVFDRDFMRARAGFGDPSERLVFVVGMMRSGTTLVEQILASHPDVHGHGERSDIRQFAAGIPNELGGAGPYPECLASLDAVAASRYAALYRGRLERDAPGAMLHIDKLPHNFEHLGLIALLFPRARIIHCSRDPIDTCLSNYFQDFGPLNPFTYDLAALGNYHREYQRLMAHWGSVLPNPMLRIPYEQLVADPEGWSRTAVAFLGLEWNDACLNFHANERPVFTKSLWQVRQPIFRTSIDRWRPYERHLGPLVEALRE
jgi:tetratricopeptide (TPR) repeat protein